MRQRRWFSILGAIWVAGAILCCAQSPAKDPLQERVRHADDLQDKGALQESRILYQSVLKTLPADQPSRELGHVLNGLSNVSSSLGEYKEAIEFAGRAEDVYRKLNDIDGQAYALNNRGIPEGELGDYSKAQATFRQALTFSQQAADLETQVRTLNNLGNAYYFPGQYFESLRAYQDAWKILEAHPGEKWNDYWHQITRFNEATLYQRLGRYQNALQIYKTIESSKGLSAADRGHLLTNLGVLYRRLGDSWKALDAYQDALALSSRQRDSVGEISALKNIGIVYALDRDDLQKARTFFERALARAQQTHNKREVMQAHLYLGETELRQTRIAESQREFRDALAQARQLKTTEEQWKALYGLGRAGELSGEAAPAESDYRQAIEIIETTRAQLQLSALRAEFLADKRDAYDALIAMLLKKNDVKEAFLFLERSRARTFQDRWASGQGEQEVVSPLPLSLDEVRGYLDPGTILMEYWVAGDRLALLWCTRESFGAGQVQFPAAEKEDILRLLRGFPGVLGADWSEKTAMLGRLIPPSVSMPATVRHALIVPDGWLSSVPFELAPMNSAGAILIERVDISYLPTATILRRPAIASRGLLGPWRQELVAFGDPVIPSYSSEGAGFENRANVAALPYSAEEVKKVARMANGRAALNLGNSNLKSEFLSVNGRTAPILHVSTHAFADADIPENSRILFSSESKSGTAEYVFLRELYELDLRQVNLATLSACDTERGKMIRGEGLQAFGRALLYAGSRSAVTTLWRVADQPTSEFMQQFYYFALKRHQTKAEALRSAKLRFLHSGSELANPAHWAGFVLTGDGLTPLPRFISWVEFTVGAVVAMMLLAMGVWVMLRVRRRVNRIDSSKHVVA